MCRPCCSRSHTPSLKLNLGQRSLLPPCSCEEIHIGPSTGKWSQPPRLRIQSAVFMKLAFSRARSASGTPVSPMAWSMQSTH